MNHPSAQQIGRFIKCWDAAMHFDAQQQIVRGQTAFDPKEWPDKPDPDVVAVYDWLCSLALNKYREGDESH